MNKVWLYIIDIFFGIVIMFISVTVYFGLRTETVMKSMYENITDSFITDIKKTGILTVEDYEKYMEFMDIGDTVFDLDFEHRYKVFEPEYRIRTLEEIIEEQNKKYTEKNEYYYKEVVTEKPYVEDPINDGNLNTETNESVLAKSKSTPADPNHVHDENCYGGHKHTGNPYFIHKHSHSGNCTEYVSYVEVYVTCNECQKRYIGGVVDYYWNADTNSLTLNFMNLDGTKTCPYCGSTSITQEEQISYYQWSCGYNLEDGVIGSTERVPKNVIYEYKKSNPQESYDSITFKSGCYVYHNSKDIRDLYEYSDRDHLLILNSASNAFNIMMYNDLFEGYCYIPRYIRLGLSTKYYYNNKTLSDLPNLCYITYQPYVNSDGEIRFKFVNYMYKDYNEKQVTGSNNPGFPTNITAQELIDLSREFQIKSYFNQFFGSWYISRITDYTGHLQWFNGSIYGDNTEYVKVCDFDHSLGTNKWVTTCGYDEDDTVDCDKIIVSLVPTHPTQKVYVNDPLITTATATYKNGSTKTVVCSANFTTSNIGPDQDVTLVYNYTIDGKNYSKSCIIKVTVIPRNKTCSKGHIYNLNSDGTDPGCPYCKAWVENLRVIRPTTLPLVITIGTTLQENGVTLLVTYMDGHTEEIMDGYIDNLDKNYYGTMQVTIGYKGATTTITVITVREKIKCDICGYEYELYPDGTNPGCPGCIQKTPVFTGNIMEYELINNTEEILEELYEKGKYVFNIDDVFTVTVKNKSSNMARIILKKIYPSMSDRWIFINKSERIMVN